MSTITKQWLQQKIAEMEATRDDIPFGLDEDDSNTLAALRIALASLEAKPIGAFHIADQQVGGTTDYIKDGEWPIDDGVIEVYAAPPEPVDKNPLREFAREYIESWELGMAGDSSLLTSARKAIADSEILQPAPVSVPDDYFSSLVAAARVRADKAMRKFPQPNYVLNKVAEESGEVIKAVIHFTEGREEWQNVEGEIIDNLAMLIRLVMEGDQVIGFTPPDACRAAMLQGAEPVTTAYKLPANTPCKDAPEHIWLQTAGVWPENGEFSELTWCSDNQHPDDTLYVRADVVDGNSPVIPDGWKLVPVEPTEHMIVEGFESEPDEFFSDEEVWEEYDAMSGCQQAAHRAKLCWAAMIASAPKPEA
ncbi:hypothetical protein L8P35_10855 [Enterobacter cloacae]|uniref:hypothetical protein n=1 Tax=Enterobacter cloacae TaxID=550 RepID=UPI0020068B2B|nr:hypothetical protein [Enterobacter cloacae]MCK7317201.1 hypothetical protein [Enterobacter cloacae]